MFIDEIEKLKKLFNFLYLIIILLNIKHTINVNIL